MIPCGSEETAKQLRTDACSTEATATLCPPLTCKGTKGVHSHGTQLGHFPEAPAASQSSDVHVMDVIWSRQDAGGCSRSLDCPGMGK